MISEYRDLIVFFAGFLIIVLASEKIGAYFARIRLPLISGFLFAGVLAGPFVLDLITAEAIESLRFLEETALAFIAFVAGSELYLNELRDRFKSIKWVTAGLILATFTLGTLAVFLLSDLIPFAAQFPVSYRVAIAILAGSILVAISPSSALAIVETILPFFNQYVGKNMALNMLAEPFQIGAIILASMLVGMLGGLYPAFFLSSYRPAHVMGSSSSSNKRASK